MLQIITGKFFRDVELYKTQHRAVLYTNARLFGDVSTVVGSLSRTDVNRDVNTLVYEVEERLEAVRPDGDREVLVSVGGDYLASDFAAIVAFVWRAVCSTSVDLVRRLTKTLPSLAGVDLPSKYVERIFDREVSIKPDDNDQLIEFTDQLIGLERAQYRQVMRAIRRYNVALQRMGDDLPLAYLLLVASIESLAQAFDNFEPTWEDLDQRKRSVLDKALEGVSSDITGRVRAAVLQIEHVALSRRYREFALARIGLEFFRRNAQGCTGPARRRDLPKALGRAYGLRSELVHRLGELPRLLAASPTRGDVLFTDDSPTLTFNGLARVAREVIINVVREGRKVETEPLDYRRELPNILTAKLAPRYWVWRVAGLNDATANPYLAGFLSELAAVLRGDSEAKITDIRDVLVRIEEIAPGLAAADRLPMLVLYHLFHWHLSQEWHRPGFEDFLRKFESELGRPSTHSLIAHVVTQAEIDWPVAVHDAEIERYFAQRFHKRGLHVDPLFETAVLLHAARQRLMRGSPQEAAGLLGQAVEHMPGFNKLVALEERMLSGELTSAELDWRGVLTEESERPGNPDNGNAA